MKSLEKIKAMKDSEIRDELLRVYEQQKILEMTLQEYEGYLLILRAEETKREIANRMNLRK